jgi:hypothetical protein
VVWREKCGGDWHPSFQVEKGDLNPTAETIQRYSLSPSSFHGHDPWWLLGAL